MAKAAIQLHQNCMLEKYFTSKGYLLAHKRNEHILLGVSCLGGDGLIVQDVVQGYVIQGSP